MTNLQRLESEGIFDQELKLGQKVQVRWTNCNRYLMGEAVVCKINNKTVKVHLLHSVAHDATSGWPAGHCITVPRFLTNGYSVNNGVYPMTTEEGIKTIAQALAPDHRVEGSLQNDVWQAERKKDEIPEVLTAPWLKRFFKAHFGIPVRVEGANRDSYVTIWIPCDRSVDHRQPIVYHHQFPAELGRRCMNIVYKGSDKLTQQDWGGNIGSHSIAMLGHELRELLRGLIDNPIQVPNESE